MRVAIGPSSFAEADPAPLRLLEAAGCDVLPNPFGRRLNEAEIIEHLKGVDGLIAGLEPLNARVIGSSDRLRAIARVGIGVANVDIPFAESRGVKVSNTPDGPTRAVAEATLAAALYFARELGPMNADLHAGTWNKRIAPGLRDVDVMIIGYGRIGRSAGDLFRAFGARVLVSDPAVGAGDLRHGEELVDLHDGLARSDVISLHAGGEHVILGSAELAKVKPGAVLLNSARGELVDETALLAALDGGRLRGAWFDAFWKEPYDGALLGRSNVLLTPHAATYTTPCRRSMETDAVRNLLRDLA